MKDKKKEETLTSSQNKSRDKIRSQADIAAIRQNSRYNHTDSAAPDNNLFWEKTSNPLSSKGN